MQMYGNGADDKLQNQKSAFTTKLFRNIDIMYAYCAVNKPAKMEWWALRFIECMSNLYLLICEMNHRFLVKCGGWFLFLELSDSCVCVCFFCSIFGE